VGQRRAQMTMGGSVRRRGKDGGRLSWKQAIQQTALQEDRLRDLMLSHYSYASIPYQQTSQLDQIGEGVKLKQKKEQVEESQGLQKEMKRAQEGEDDNDKVREAGGGEKEEDEGIGEETKQAVVVAPIFSVTRRYRSDVGY